MASPRFPLSGETLGTAWAPRASRWSIRTEHDQVLLSRAQLETVQRGTLPIRTAPRLGPEKSDYVLANRTPLGDGGHGPHPDQSSAAKWRISPCNHRRQTSLPNHRQPQSTRTLRLSPRVAP